MMKFPTPSFSIVRQRPQQRVWLVMIAAVCAAQIGQAEAAFKCQGPDGKVEYSDRACETSKNTLDKPKTNTGVQSRAIGNPMEQLEKLFADYEARLCEREKLEMELDTARRAGEVAKQPAAWKARQDRQTELNDILVDFQMRAGKITKPAGNDSKETAALRKYQLSLKKCAVAAPVAPVASATPATPATAAPPAMPATSATKAPPTAPKPAK